MTWRRQWSGVAGNTIKGIAGLFLTIFILGVGLVLKDLNYISQIHFQVILIIGFLTGFFSFMGLIS